MTTGDLLTRDWLLGYFGLYLPVPPIVRYSHDAAHGGQLRLHMRQLSCRDRAFKTYGEGGAWAGKCGRQCHKTRLGHLRDENPRAR